MDEPTPQPEQPVQPEQPAQAAQSEQQVQPVQPEQIAGLEPGMTIVRRVRGPRRWPGILSGVLALAMLASTALGIQLASRNELTLSTSCAYAAIAFSVAALVLGLIAIAKRWGRGAGIAGAVVAVLGNPLVLLYGLSALGGS